MDRQQFRMQRKRKIRRRRIFWFLVFPLLMIAIAGTAYGAFLYQKTKSVVQDSFHDERGKSDLREKKVDPNIDNVSVLFIGVDESKKRENSGNSRSDALMLATFNKDKKSVNLLTIPRDSYVYVEEVGYKTKINHAHAYGGPSATIETIEDLLEIPVDYYVRLDFEAFMEVVDTLGGIEVEVPYTFTEQDSKDRADAITLYEGVQTLNGEEALALARTRKKDNDIERGKRQQEIMKAILEKATSSKAIVKYADMIEAIGNNMKTDMTFDEMKAFIDYALSKNLDIKTFTAEGSDLYLPNSNGQNIYYWELDEANLGEIKGKLRVHLDIDSWEPRTSEMASETIQN